MQQSAMTMALFLKTCALGDCTGISFIDSTPIRVCKNKRIKRNKVFKGIDNTGKSTIGWFYDFKLHIIINDKGYIGQELMQNIFVDGVQLFRHIRNNMKNSRPLQGVLKKIEFLIFNYGINTATYFSG